MIKLLVIWESGETSMYEYENYPKAEQAKKNLKMVFGNQISFMCIY